MDTEEKSGDKKNKVNMVNVEKKKITNDDVGDITVDLMASESEFEAATERIRRERRNKGKEMRR